MILKLYLSLWLFGVIAATILYLTGNLTPFLKVLFGLFTFGALAFGFISIVPATIFHGEPREH
jgi:hypothetical protein